MSDDYVPYVLDRKALRRAKAFLKPKKPPKPPKPRKVFVKLSPEELDAFTEDWRIRELEYYRIFWMIAEGWYDDPKARKRELEERAARLRTMTLQEVRELELYKTYSKEFRPKEYKKLS